MLPQYKGKFEGVRIYETSHMGVGHHSAGITLPGIGIIVGMGVFSLRQDMDLIRHEYGHILQYRKIGFLRFYFLIGISSLLSARSSGHGRGHQNHWTEYWCNYLSRLYFHDASWNTNHYPCKDITDKSKYWLGISV